MENESDEYVSYHSEYSSDSDYQDELSDEGFQQQICRMTEDELYKYMVSLGVLHETTEQLSTSAVDSRSISSYKFLQTIDFPAEGIKAITTRNCDPSFFRLAYAIKNILPEIVVGDGNTWLKAIEAASHPKQVQTVGYICLILRGEHVLQTIDYSHNLGWLKAMMIIDRKLNFSWANPLFHSLLVYVLKAPGYENQTGLTFAQLMRAIPEAEQDNEVYDALCALVKLSLFNSWSFGRCLPLFYAAENCPRLISVLLKCGVDPNQRNEEGETALHVLVIHGNRSFSEWEWLEAFKNLLTAGTNMYAKTKGTRDPEQELDWADNATRKDVVFGFTVFSRLIKCGNHLALIELIRAGYAALTVHNCTALHICCIKPEIITKNLLQAFADKKYNFNRKNDFKQTALHCYLNTCSDRVEVSELIEVFKSYGANPALPDKNGNNCAMIAVIKNKRVEIISALMVREIKEKINAVNANKLNILAIALTEYKRKELPWLVNMLMNVGAILQQSFSDQTFIEKVCANKFFSPALMKNWIDAESNISVIDTALCKAVVGHRRIDLVKYMVTSNIHVLLNWPCVLIDIAKNLTDEHFDNCRELCIWLLDQNIDPYKRDNNGLTFLHYLFALNNFPESYRTILEHNSIMLHHEAFEGLLNAALQKGRYKMARTMVRNYATLEGLSLENMQVKPGFSVIVKKLCDYGYKVKENDASGVTAFARSEAKRAKMAISVKKEKKRLNSWLKSKVLTVEPLWKIALRAHRVLHGKNTDLQISQFDFRPEILDFLSV
ncbi:hypothetical protein HDE_03296 [Halotydeus destructor]|nr:hypothetical protein HDE_03296 [Halotydeus destructor]